MTQRLRLTFSKDGPMRYVAHLDTMRTWERAVRRARLPLAYTQGFSPHARIALAAPLPVGVVGRRELMDAWFEEPVPPHEAIDRLNAAMPPGLRVVAAEEVGEKLPSLQSSLRSAQYEARFDPDSVDAETLRERVERLLALDTLEWEEQRGEKTRRYDLRQTILDLAVRAGGPDSGASDGASDRAVVLDMHLSLEEGRTGRPAQVLRALEVDPDPVEVTRTDVRIDQPQVAMQAWRERGKFEE